MKHNRNSMQRISTLVAALTAASSMMARAGTCTINVTANQQVIDGYGFSTAWCGALTSAKNNSLYNTLGMSLLRIRIDQNNNWADETANASAAHAAGAKVLGCPWYIPNSFRSGNTIPSSQYVNYCNWLKSAATSINLDYVSIKNEPDGSATDGNLSGDQIRDIIKAGGSNIGKPVVCSDAINFNDAWTDPTLNDSTAVGKVSVISGHLYGGGLNVHQNALNHGKHVWMTEYYVNGINDINACMTIAKQISDCMNDQFSAYIWWWVNDNDGNVNLVNSSGVINKNGYTIGQFAKWVRPGKNRCTATYNPTTGVYTTAYHNGGIVIVAVNTGTSSVSQPFTIQNATGVNSFQVNRTSASENMAGVSSATVVNNTFTYTLPAKSITTFHQF
jgi:glucuronoarabinoxylan endo-1,4-beta-xylanase